MVKNLKEKTMKIGQNMTNRTTNSKINKDSNTNQNMPSKSRVKVFANINNSPSGRGTGCSGLFKKSFTPFDNGFPLETVILG